MLEIRYFVTSSRKPVYDFIAAQPGEAVRMILKEKERLEKYGLILAMTDHRVKKVHSHPLYELRVMVERLHYRLLFTTRESTCWFVSAFIKKTSKIPQQELKKALARAKQIPRGKNE